MSVHTCHHHHLRSCLDLTTRTLAAQATFKPLLTAALNGHKLCLAHLLLADPAMLQLKTRGCSAADYARKYDEPEVVAALEKWTAGDKAGALRELGAADLISSLPPSSSSAAAAATPDKASSSQMVQVSLCWSMLPWLWTNTSSPWQRAANAPASDTTPPLALAVALAPSADPPVSPSHGHDEVLPASPHCIASLAMAQLPCCTPRWQQ